MVDITIIPNTSLEQLVILLIIGIASILWLAYHFTKSWKKTGIIFVGYLIIGIRWTAEPGESVFLFGLFNILIMIFGLYIMFSQLKEV